MSAKKMQENLEQFLQMVSQDLELQEKLKAASDHEAYISLIVELGKEKGYNFNSDSVETLLHNAAKKAAENEVSVSKLSDSELASVAGGFFFTGFFTFANPTSDCETKINCFSQQILCTANFGTNNPFQCPGA